MYDYDYIELLKQSGKGKEAMEIVRSIATGFTDWEKDPAKVEAARTALGELLAQSAATTGPTKPPSSAGSLSVPVIESSPFSDTSGSDGLL